MSGWYCASSDRYEGPYSETDIVEFLENGLVDGDTLVWREGQANWLPLRQTELAAFLPKETGEQAFARAAKGVPPPPPGARRSREKTVPPEMPPGEGSAKHPPIAAFWRRVIAFWIDSCLVSFLMFFSLVLSFAFVREGAEIIPTAPWETGSSFGGEEPTQAPPNNDGWRWFFFLMPAVVYHTLLIGSEWQATIGKRFLGIYVVTDRGERLTYVNAFLRHLFSYISWLFFWIGFLLALVSDQRKALHDMMAQTKVVLGRPGKKS